MVSSFLKQNGLSWKTYILFGSGLMFTNCLPDINVSENRKGKKIIKFDIFLCQSNRTGLKNGLFSAKLESGGSYRVIWTGY